MTPSGRPKPLMDLGEFHPSDPVPEIIRACGDAGHSPVVRVEEERVGLECTECGVRWAVKRVEQVEE